MIINYIVLQEYIRLGQRISKFTVETWNDGIWQEVATGTTIGHKRIISLDHFVETQWVRINIENSRACPVLSHIEIY